MATSSPFLPVGSRAALATRLQAMLLYLPPPPIQPPVRLDFLSLLDGDKTIYASDTPNRVLTGGYTREHADLGREATQIRVLPGVRKKNPRALTHAVEDRS